MANAVYPHFKQSLLTELDANKSLDQTGANGTYLVLLDIASPGGHYTYSDTHQFYTSLSAIQGTELAISTPVVDTGGVFKGDTMVFVNVTGTTVGAFAIFRKNTGANTTWRLVLYEDTAIIGFPVLANGGNIVVDWNDAGIFQL